MSGVFLFYYWFTTKECPFSLQVEVVNNNIKTINISKSPYNLNLTKVDSKVDTFSFIDEKGNIYYFLKDKLKNEKINEIDLISEDLVYYYNRTWASGAEIVSVFKIINRWIVLSGFFDIFLFIFLFPGLYLLWDNGYKGKDPIIPED